MKIRHDEQSITFEFEKTGERTIAENFREIGEAVAFMRANRCKYESELITRGTARILREFCKTLRDAEKGNECP